MPGAVVRDNVPAWLRPENASVFDSFSTRFLRRVATLIGATDPNSAVFGMAGEMGGPGAGDGALNAAVDYLEQKFPRLANYIKAYHGSPHDFERFDASKIGTGEGAQAYGHGLYFAENEGVAKSYRDNLAQVPVYRGDPAYAHAAQSFKEAGASRDEALRGLQMSYRHADAGDLSRAVAATYADPGRVYEVGINAQPDQFLDWDKPLSQQGERIQNLARQAFPNVQPVRTSDGMYSVTSVPPGQVSGRVLPVGKHDTPQAAMQAFNDWALSQSGEDLYRMLSRAKATPGAFPEIMVPRPAAASQALQQAGIPGIKYLDQGSRAAGDGSRNFVVFDDKLIDVLRKYGVALPFAGAAAASWWQANQPQGQQP